MQDDTLISWRRLTAACVRHQRANFPLLNRMRKKVFVCFPDYCSVASEQLFSAADTQIDRTVLLAKMPRSCCFLRKTFACLNSTTRIFVCLVFCSRNVFYTFSTSVKHVIFEMDYTLFLHMYMLWQFRPFVCLSATLPTTYNICEQVIDIRLRLRFRPNIQLNIRQNIGFGRRSIATFGRTFVCSYLSRSGDVVLLFFQAKSAPHVEVCSVGGQLWPFVAQLRQVRTLFVHHLVLHVSQLPQIIQGAASAPPPPAKKLGTFLYALYNFVEYRPIFETFLTVRIRRKFVGLILYYD